MKNKLIRILFVVTLFGSASAFAASSLNARTQALEKQVRLLKSQVSQMQDEKTNKSDISAFPTMLELYGHGPAVVASPAFLMRGVDKHELMVDLSGINNDLLLLKLRQKMDDYAIEHNIATPRGPVIALSGGAEILYNYDTNSSYSKTSKGNINLTHAELDVIGEAGPWATAAMLITYNDSDTITGNNVSKAKSSRIQLDRGWLTFGQLSKSPVYLTVGQLFASFGKYSTYRGAPPPTKILGRVKDRMAILGYEDSGLYAQIYGLSGSTKISGSESNWSKILRHGGVGVGYANDISDNFKMRIGGGVLGNFAETESMLDIFGKKQDSSYETLQSRVTAYNLHAKLSIYDFGLIAEYVGASKEFDTSDLTFNGHGAKPQALSFEGAYSFMIKNKLNTISTGYGMTSQALALGMDKQNYFAKFSTMLAKNVIASVEYNHNVNYGWNDTGDSAPRISTVVVNDKPSRHNNVVTLWVGVYF